MSPVSRNLLRSKFLKFISKISIKRQKFVRENCIARENLTIIKFTKLNCITSLLFIYLCIRIL